MGFSKWNPKQTRPLKRRQDIVRTRRLEVLTWDALVVIYSHTGFYMENNEVNVEPSKCRN